MDGDFCSVFPKLFVSWRYLIMAHLMSTCFSLVSDHVPGVRCLVFDVMLAYMLPHYEIMALCGIRAHLEHLVSIFLMRDIKWVAVLRDYCLGDPRGPSPPLLLYTLGTNLVEELNPIS